MPQPRHPDQRPTDQRPTVLLVNPNSSPATTASMTVLAEEALRPSGLRVRGLTAPAGPAMIVDEVALAAAAGHVVDAVEGDLRSGGAPVAVVVGAVGDPGRGGLARGWRCPSSASARPRCWPPGTAPQTGSPASGGPPADRSGTRHGRSRPWASPRSWSPVPSACALVLRVLAGRTGPRG